MTNDLTKGSPIKLILFYSLPILIGNIFQQLYSMVDTIIVGKYLGVNSLAAVGSTGPISFLILGFVMGLTSGFAVVSAQKFGAKNYDALRQSVATSIWLCVLLTIVMTTLSVIFVKPMLIFMRTPNDILEEAYQYILVIFAGMATTVFYNMISSILRAIGDSKTPLYFLIVSSIINIILDLLFITNFKMGVAGAGYATVIAQGLSGFFCLIYTIKKYPILKLKKSDFHFTVKAWSKHMKIGLPMAFQFSITAIGTMVLQTALNTLGSVMVAAFTAASKVEQLLTQPAATFGVTMANYTGQNLGAGKIDRIREGVTKCTIITLLFSIAGTFLAYVGGETFLSLFMSGDNPELRQEVMKNAIFYVRILATFFPILALLFVYRNALQGMGDGFIPLMAGVCELLVRVIVAFTLPSIIGFTGICFASPIAWIAATIPLFIKYIKTISKMMKNYDNGRQKNKYLKRVYQKA